MSYLAKSPSPNVCYINLKFDLSSVETLSVAERTRELFKYDERSFFFLSNYLYQSCLSLESQAKTPKEILTLLGNSLK